MNEILLDADNPDPDLVSRAAAVVSGGGLVVFPTDTVYGLGADLRNKEALHKLFGVKGRSAAKGLIAMVAEVEDMRHICAEVSSSARRLANRFWPGPLTLVLSPAPDIHAAALVDGRLGVRLPDNTIARALIRAVGSPLATTSANPSMRPPPVTAAEAAAGIGSEVDLIINGGRCTFGIESTVVDPETRPPRIFREGAVSKEALSEVLQAE